MACIKAGACATKWKKQESRAEVVVSKDILIILGKRDLKLTWAAASCWSLMGNSPVRFLSSSLQLRAPLIMEKCEINFVK